MFAAAATIAQMVFDLSISIARWIATKVFIVAIMAILLPWVLRGFLIWGFEYFVEHGRTIATFLMDQINTATDGSYDVNIQLSGVGGYLAEQTGLIDYCAIIFTGWGIYWTIAVLAKATPRL